jgi:large subunit ribosomal protein L18
MTARVHTEKRRRWRQRRKRVRKTIERSERVWLTIYRSSKHIYAQLVDAPTGRTLATASSRSKDVLGSDPLEGKVDAAKRVGAAIAALAREKEIEEVVFNRNGFLYHGRVKALADAAREAGLRF